MIFCFRKLSRKGIYYFFGKKRSGKTALSIFASRKWRKARYPVFSCDYVADTYAVPSEFWLYSYPENSLILCDEIGTRVGYARSWKTTPKELIEFNKLSGHEKISIVYNSQAPADADAAIRAVIDYWFEVIPIFPRGLLSYALPWRAKWAEDEVEGMPHLVLSKGFFSFLGGFFFCPIRQARRYNSFSSNASAREPIRFQRQ